MEVNYISEWRKTCFYIDFEHKTYGICINIKDIDSAEEIIKNVKETRRATIETLKDEWKVGAA